MGVIKKDLISYFTFDSLDQAGLLHGVFMRHGGCSPQPWQSLNLATSVGDTRENVIENRNRISDALSIERDCFHDVWQVHSSKVVYAQNPRKIGKDHIKADGIITDKENVVLLMLFADCVPIFLYDPGKNVIGCAHAGWQGTFKRVAAEAVKAMVVKFGSKPANIMAAIGPSICAEHYEVGQDVVDAAQTTLKDYHKVVSRIDGRYHVDLPMANQLILQEAGVVAIEQSNICTMSNNEDWFSHRAEHGRTGRFGAVITLRKK